ncbi:MAG: uroporphyrinogen-III synthase [Calditrichia bacterium]
MALAKRLIELGLDAEIYEKAANLQSLMSHISKIHPEETVRLIACNQRSIAGKYFTRNSGNVILRRVPLYQTIANERFDSDILAEILTGKFDVFVFSSPTSFDYFQQIIAGNDLLRSTAIAVFGETQPCIFGKTASIRNYSRHRFAGRIV